MKSMKQAVSLMAGLALCGMGSYLSIQANIGLAPWDALNMGVALLAGRSYGDMAVVVGLAILVIDVLLGEKIGIGTILNTVLIGKFVDLYAFLGLLPRMESFASGVVMLFFSQLSMSVGIFLYMRTGMGSGPRDSLMVAASKRLPKVPVGALRGTLECLALLGGWLMGAKVGIGTLVSMFGISFVMQATFTVVRFDPKSVRHENVFETIRRLRNKQTV